MFAIPSTSFNEDMIIQQEIADYDGTINAIGLLKVKDNKTGETLYENDGNPWFLIEHMDQTRIYKDSLERYFEKDDDAYSYEWIAFRVR